MIIIIPTATAENTYSRRFLIAAYNGLRWKITSIHNYHARLTDLCFFITNITCICKENFFKVQTILHAARRIPYYFFH